MYQDYMKTPIGYLAIQADNDAVLSILFFDEADALKRQGNHHTAQAISQLNEYFAGTRKEFDLPLKPKGTEFQQQVWKTLRSVDFAKTCSYGDIANKINKPKAVRAVGAANGKNLFTIVVPCHRIIGKNGALTGYAGGMSRKEWLLKHETKSQ